MLRGAETDPDSGEPEPNLERHVHHCGHRLTISNHRDRVISESRERGEAPKYSDSEKSTGPLAQELARLGEPRDQPNQKAPHYVDG